MYHLLLRYQPSGLKGDYLAIATLKVAEIIRIVLNNLSITGGASGISNIKMLMSWPLLYVFVVLTILLTHNFKILLLVVRVFQLKKMK